MKDINISIIAGCFPVQHNIPHEKLYHQILKQKLESKNQISPKYEIVRYERLSSCFGKVVNSISTKKPEILIFHMRGEPILRIAKLYYKYANKDNKVKKTINVPYLNILMPEKFYLLGNNPQQGDPHKNNWHYWLREMNYLFGNLIGNFHFGMRKYLGLLEQVKKCCDANNIKLLVCGTASRPHTKWENFISNKIHKRSLQKAKELGIEYINCIGEYSTEGEFLFFENGIHVSEAGHRLTAEKMYEKLLDIL